MANPIIAEVTRGGIVESVHRGAYAVVDGGGRIIASGGDIEYPIFPRSAIKAFQCLPLIESGAAARFGFSDEEIALACASHRGEDDHLRVARSMLLKAGNSEENYECGAHWPSASWARDELVRQGRAPHAIHNNCSGKHAGMLALARHLEANPKGYINANHPVQREIARTIGSFCDCNLDELTCGIDGCSVPTWAIPLRSLALGFARFTQIEEGRRITRAVRDHPFMVAGTGKFDTVVMSDVPDVFIKTGAEGVYCGCVPASGIGIAIKCDDGEKRAASALMALLLAQHGGLDQSQRFKLLKHSQSELRNWNKIAVGSVRAVT